VLQSRSINGKGPAMAIALDRLRPVSVWLGQEEKRGPPREVVRPTRAVISRVRRVQRQNKKLPSPLRTAQPFSQACGTPRSNSASTDLVIGVTSSANARPRYKNTLSGIKTTSLPGGGPRSWASKVAALGEFLSQQGNGVPTLFQQGTAS
jgi:hypothetical protein